MKKRRVKKISLQKTIISKFTTNHKAKDVLGGRGTSPKCAYSAWESCPE
jgi:hypothetical protein